jgi:hypothetical protein
LQFPPVLREHLAVPREVVLLERRRGQRRLGVEEVRELFYERLALVQQVPDLCLRRCFLVGRAGGDG